MQLGRLSAAVFQESLQKSSPAPGREEAQETAGFSFSVTEKGQGERKRLLFFKAKVELAAD